MNARSNLTDFGPITASIAIAILLLTGMAGQWDDRTLHGVPVWSELTKFHQSFALHIATLVVFRSLLPVDLHKTLIILPLRGYLCDRAKVEPFGEGVVRPSIANHF